MFEQLDDREEAPQVSRAMTLGILAAYMVGAFGGLCIFIILGERSFGVQIATAIMYTYFAFWYVFFPTRGLLEQYSLRNKNVQGRIPLLLAIHSAFLILIFFGETIWFSMKPHLPSYWFTEHGKRGGPLYISVVIVSVTALFFIEVLTSRRVLSRSVSEAMNESGNMPTDKL
jgi:hypothetical protein